jgi:protein involved in polysaccharide export with SLBB domain
VDARHLGIAGKIRAWRGPAFALLLLAAPAALLAAGLPTAPRSERFKAGEALILTSATDTGSFLDGGYPIDSAGYADLPILKRVQVHGRTQDELENFLSEKLSNHLRDVHLKAAPAIRLTLLGNFERQGLHYVDPKATLWEAVLQAGGMADERKLDEIHVRRGAGNVDIDVWEQYSRGATVAAAGFRSGDVIVLPVSRPDEGFWFYFRESLSATAQIATIASTVLTVYITYQLLDLQRNQQSGP